MDDTASRELKSPKAGDEIRIDERIRIVFARKAGRLVAIVKAPKKSRVRIAKAQGEG